MATSYQIHTTVLIEEDGTMSVCFPYGMCDVDEVIKDGESLYPFPPSSDKKIRAAMTTALKTGAVKLIEH